MHERVRGRASQFILHVVAGAAADSPACRARACLRGAHRRPPHFQRRRYKTAASARVDPARLVRRRWRRRRRHFPIDGGPPLLPAAGSAISRHTRTHHTQRQTTMAEIRRTGDDATMPCTGGAIPAAAGADGIIRGRSETCQPWGSWWQRRACHPCPCPPVTSGRHRSACCSCL